MSSFEISSTHYTNWLFTPEELNRIRRLRCYKAFLALSKDRKTRNEPAANGTNDSLTALSLPRKPRSFACLVCQRSKVQADPEAADDSVTEPTDEQLSEMEKAQDVYLTAEEEETIKTFYEDKIREACILLRTSDKVKATATLLFKRFYLSNSIMEFAPRSIMLTAMYLAGKTEEQYIKVDTIAEELDVDFNDILIHEMPLLEGLRFQLICYHPFRPLLGFIEDCRQRRLVRSTEAIVEELQKLHFNANALVNKLLLTDAPLLFPPAQLALAALRKAVAERRKGDELPLIDVNEYIENVFAKKGDTAMLQRALDEIERLIDAAGTMPEKAELKRVNKKLKPFAQPGKDDGEAAKEPKKKKHKSGKRKNKDKDEDNDVTMADQPA